MCRGPLPRGSTTSCSGTQARVGGPPEAHEIQPMSVVATQPAGQEDRLMRARDAGCRILRDLDRLGRGRLGVVVRHEMAVLVAGRRAQRPGRVGEIGPATQIDAGAAIGAAARVDAAGQVDRAAEVGRLGVRTVGVGGRDTEDGRGGPTGGIQTSCARRVRRPSSSPRATRRRARPPGGRRPHPPRPDRRRARTSRHRCGGTRARSRRPRARRRAHRAWDAR